MDVAGHSSNVAASNFVNEDDYVIHLLTNPKELIDWSIQNGLVAKEGNCEGCKLPLQYKIESDLSVIWTCLSNNSECVKYNVNGRILFGNCKDIRDQLYMLHNWYKQKSPVWLINERHITSKDYSEFVTQVQEACLVYCQNNNSLVGGNGIEICVEVSKRLGTSNRDQLYIGGIEKNSDKWFICEVPKSAPSSQSLQLQGRFIAPGTVVYTRTAKMYIDPTIKRRVVKKWSLLFQTDCLAEDILREWFSRKQRPFCELANIVAKYFASLHK